MENQKIHQAGFSLPEMLLTVAVMAVLITLMFPTFSKFIEESRNRTETATQQELRRALEAYAKDKNILPPDETQTSGTDPEWWEELVPYTNLAEEEIRTDVWNRPRIYRRTEPLTEQFRDTSFDTYYATIYSAGGDGLVAANSVNVGDTGVSPDVDDTGWWAEDSDPVEEYGEIEVTGDDQIVKFTDLKIKTENYFKTFDRLEKVVEALESYAAAKRNEALVANEAIRQSNLTISQAANQFVDLDTGLNDNDRYIDSTGTEFVSSTPGTTTEPVPYLNINDLVFYPPADHPSSGSPNTDSATYFPTVEAEANNFLSQSFGSHGSTSGLRKVLNRTDNDARRDSMIDLMRLLGLPDEYCCNALLRDEVDLEDIDTAEEVPFYYFSNPRPRTFGGGSLQCGTRPTTAPFLPPRVTVDFVDDSAGTSTQAPTCG